ncbi:sigma factor-like helix-turn-helix DNA-binding protein [Umezawaea sp. NPDC059074]|uniref:sigma factor-like helix-turn-helix DNA-binding protein n=1 Tax=Umezawaea sp. NPDC059074 TaxID=3346716 RepID=UPI003691DAA4
MNSAQGFPSDDTARLLVAAGRGDVHAFGQFYDRVVGTIVECVHAVVGDPVRAEKIAHEVLVEVWATAGSYSPDRGDAVSWTVRLAQRRATEQVASAPEVEYADTAPVRQDRGRVADGLTRLTRSQREVFLRVHRQGQTYREVGKAMGVSVVAVRALARDAVALLRDVLA